jgi:hypothetical protein
MKVFSIVCIISMALGAAASCHGDCKIQCNGNNPGYCNAECVGRCMQARCPEYVAAEQTHNIWTHALTHSFQNCSQTPISSC